MELGRGEGNREGRDTCPYRDSVSDNFFMMVKMPLSATFKKYC